MKIQIEVTLTDGEPVVSHWSEFSFEEMETTAEFIRSDLLGSAPDKGGYLSLQLSETEDIIIPKNRIVTVIIRRKDDDA